MISFARWHASDVRPTPKPAFVVDADPGGGFPSHAIGEIRFFCASGSMDALPEAARGAIRRHFGDEHE